MENLQVQTKQSLVAAHAEGKHNDRHRERCASCRDRVFVQLCECGKHPEGVGWTQDPKVARNTWGEGGYFEAKKSECTFSATGMITAVASRPGMMTVTSTPLEGGHISKEHTAEVEVEDPMVEFEESQQGAEKFEEDSSGVVTPGVTSTEHYEIGEHDEIIRVLTTESDLPPPAVESKGEQVACEPKHSEVAIYKAQSEEDETADKEGRKPRLIKTMADIKPTKSQAKRIAATEPKKAAREPYPFKWEPLAQAAGGPMFLAKALGISYITLRKIVRRNKSGNPDLVQRVRNLAKTHNVESPL